MREQRLLGDTGSKIQLAETTESREKSSRKKIKQKNLGEGKGNNGQREKRCCQGKNR